ncbi:uncharacterized protein PG986_002447 [Apiospora aurea]|uniref:Uncharacterized protein n=1 Tax=Apiospora aurea TaxID=335848 RepID=A0ABR1QNV5_9PEZI
MAATLFEERAGPVTQIFYLSIPVEHQLQDATSGAGRKWAEALDLVAESPGFLRLYWGRQVEEHKKVQLHIVSPTSTSGGGGEAPLGHDRIYFSQPETDSRPVRETLEQNEDFLESPLYLDDVLPLIKSILTPPHPVHPTIPDIQIWHVHLGQQLTTTATAAGLPTFGGTPSSSSSSTSSSSLLGYPISTALYGGDDDATWVEGEWLLWADAMRRVKGCKTIAGGKLIKKSVAAALKSDGGGYLIYVGWETLQHDDEYHGTPSFKEQVMVLSSGGKGFKEYGHVVFQGVQGEE